MQALKLKIHLPAQLISAYPGTAADALQLRRVDDVFIAFAADANPGIEGLRAEYLNRLHSTDNLFFVLFSF
jgi:hypothetical protein